MVQVLNRQNHSGDFGDILGASLGHVISQAAEGYVGAKANQIKTQSRAKMFEQSGYTPEEARILGSIQDEGVLGKLISTLPAPNYQPQQYGQPQASQNAPGISPYPQKDPSQFLSELEQTPQGQKILETLGRASQKQKENLFSQFQQPPGTKEQEYAGPYSQNVYDVHNATKSRIPGLNSLMQAGTGEQGASSEPNRVQAEPRLSHGTSGQPNPAAQGSEQGHTQSTRPRFGKSDAEQKDKLEQQKISEKQQSEINKETKPYYDEVTKEAKSAKDNDIRLNRMQELIKKGNLRAPGWNNLFDTISHGVFGFGIDLHFLQNADTQEFRKLTHDMLKTAKDTFGSRLTDYDVKTFLSTLPSLSQTDEGKERVIQNLKTFNDMAKLKKKTMDEIIKENGGRRPANLDNLVDERIAPQADAYAESFKRGY